ncbi:MAG: 3-deoxy-manno-octulosonate cytidylyltransferase [Kiritimatiellia bacterium]
MKVLGVIPSRWGSTRFPGKSLQPICGRPLVLRVVDAAKQASELDEVIVATDDARIRDAVAPETRVEMTPSDLPSGTDRVARAAQPNDDDIVINIQGDEPLMDPETINALARRMKQDTCEMATVVTPIRNPRDLQARTVVKVVLDASDRALYFSRLPIPCRRDGEPDLASNLYWRHLGIYAYRGNFLKRLVAEPPCALEQCESLEQLRALWLGARIAVIKTEHQGVGIDTPEDVAIVERILLEGKV